jgi:hypothetical protein
MLSGKIDELEAYIEELWAGGEIHQRKLTVDVLCNVSSRSSLSNILSECMHNFLGSFKQKIYYYFMWVGT